MVVKKFWNWMGSHPQKFLLKILCRYIYILGGGDYWFEKKKRSLFLRIAYFIWSVFVNVFIIVVFIDEFMAFALEISEKERNDLIQRLVAKLTTYLKIVVFLIQRKNIEVIFKKLLEENREVYAAINIDRAAVKKGLILMIMVSASVTTSVVFLFYNKIKANIAEDLPIQVSLTYYPNSASTGKYADVYRFLTDFQWIYIVIMLYGVDGIACCTLVYVEHKFKTLQEYFRSIKHYMYENYKTKSHNEMQEEVMRRLKAGIQFHENCLWCAKNIQSSLGNLFSVQVVQGMTLLVNGLVKLVTSERDMTLLIGNMVFMVTTSVLTGSYMLSAGDITWEAGEVSTAIYDCGWELSTGKLNRELRTLLVLAIQRSQIPVFMTAFGIFMLSYANFMSILRSSYSFFTVLY